jgi:predicted permease
MTWWRRLWNRHALDTQLDKELRFHIEQHAADLVAQGVDPAEAQRRARLEIGGPEQVKESCRDTRGTRWADDLAQDVRYGIRALRHRAGFTAVAVGTLALGIGAATLMFTVIDGVLLKPLAYPDPERLVTLVEQTDWSNNFGNRWAFAYPNYLDCAQDTRSLTLAAWRFSGGTVTGNGDPEYVNALQVSPEFLGMLGIGTDRGRSFLDGDDRPGAAPVAIVSAGFAQRHYGGATAVGARLVFDATPYTVIGVASTTDRVPGQPEVLTLLTSAPDPRQTLRNRNIHPGIQVWGRLRPGATIEQAQAELALVGRRLADHYPDSNRGRTFIAEQLRPAVGDVGATLWLLLAAVGLVLLVACANIGSLVLARAVSRERELAMRAALGAGRGRLMRQCLTETALLGLAGGVAGVALAKVGLQPFVSFWPGTLPRADDIVVDWRVLAFAVAASLASSLVFGLAPALRVPARQLDRVLHGAGRAIRGGSRRLHAAFVAVEIALAIVLLVCAGALGRTLLRLTTVDPGVNVQNVLVARTAVSPTVLADPAGTRAAWDGVLAAARTVPGVEAVAAVDTVPLRAGNNQNVYWTSAALPPIQQRPFALTTSVTPDYARVAGLRVRFGRFFGDHDRAGSEPVIIVDDTLAQAAFGQPNAVGRQLWVPDLGPGAFTIVGVVAHVRHWGLASDDQAAVRAQLYYPFAQLPDPLVRRWSQLMSIVVRTSIPPGTLVESLRHAIRGSTSDQVMYQVQTLEDLAAASLARQRFLLLLFAGFAVLALLLASLGLYGVLAYLMSERTPEIGVRMALGARTADVVRMVLGESAGMVLVGIGVGVAAAIAASRVLQRLVDGMRGVDAATYAVVLAVLAASALAASVVPAWRACRVDATTALRQE